MNQAKHLPKSAKIFENKNIWVSLLKIMVPQILCSFINSLYVLIGQIFLNDFVPNDGVHNNESIWTNYQNVKDIWENQLPWKDGVGHPMLQLESVTSVVHSAVAISLPPIIIIAAITVWLSMGLSILFGSAVGKKSISEAQRIWTNWFFPNFLFCLIISAILIATAYPLMWNFSGANHAAQLNFISEKLTNPGAISQYEDVLVSFYREYYHAIVIYSVQYLIPVIITLFLQVFVSSVWFTLASEGKQMMMVIFSLVSNLVNILACYLIIGVAKGGMIGGGICVLITYVVNAAILVGYLLILNKRSSTLMVMNFVKFKIDWVIFVSILIVGFPSLLRNISASFALLLFQYLLVITTGAIQEHVANYWVTFGGAVMPIQNLLFSTSRGVIRSTRILFNYHLAANHQHYIKKIFLIGVFYAALMMAILYGIINNRTVGLGLMQEVFGLHIPNETIANDALKYLHYFSGSLIMYGFLMVGVTFFQAAGRVFNASLTAIFSGIGFAVIIFPVAMVIAKAQNSEEIYLASWLINSVIAGLAIFSYSLTYICRYVKSNYQTKRPVDRLEAWLTKRSKNRQIHCSDESFN